MFSVTIQMKFYGADIMKAKVGLEVAKVSGRGGLPLTQLTRRVHASGVRPCSGDPTLIKLLLVRHESLYKIYLGDLAMMTPLWHQGLRRFISSLGLLVVMRTQEILVLRSASASFLKVPGFSELS